MYLVSSRKGFWSGDIISERDEVRDCTLTAPDGEIDTPVAVEMLTNEVRNRKSLLLIHGYNNGEKRVYAAYQAIQERVSFDAYEKVIGYIWPGGHVHEYLPARNRAEACAPRLASWLDLLLENCTSLDIMCHSLGNFLALRAIRYLNPNSRKLRFGWMTAAAVHDESIEPGEEFFDATTHFEQFCVYHSRRDAVLAAAFPVVEGDLALGLCGPEDKSAIEVQAPHIRVVNCKRVIAQHSDYKQCGALYDDMNKRLRGESLPQFRTL